MFYLVTPIWGVLIKLTKQSSVSDNDRQWITKFFLVLHHSITARFPFFLFNFNYRYTVSQDKTSTEAFISLTETTGNPTINHPWRPDNLYGIKILNFLSTFSQKQRKWMREKRGKKKIFKWRIETFISESHHWIKRRGSRWVFVRKGS
jgi:hypothetical protein